MRTDEFAEYFSSFLRVDNDHIAHYMATIPSLVSTQSVDRIVFSCTYTYLHFSVSLLNVHLQVTRLHKNNLDNG